MKSSLALAFALLGSSAAFDLPDLYKNKSTGGVWYGGFSISPNGHCGLGPPTQAGIPKHYNKLNATAGVNSQLYAFNPCGMCLRVRLTEKNQTLDVFVNDECTTCGWGELNLGIEGEGYATAVWQAITCNVGPSPLEYYVEMGSEYYLKVQPRTSRCIVKSMKAISGGKWVEGVHTDDNFFEFSGGYFAYPVQVQLTSIFDEVVEDEIPSLNVGNSTVGGKNTQFASCKKAKPKSEEVPEGNTQQQQPPANAPVQQAQAQATTTQNNNTPTSN